MSTLHMDKALCHTCNECAFVNDLTKQEAAAAAAMVASMHL